MLKRTESLFCTLLGTLIAVTNSASTKDIFCIEHDSSQKMNLSIKCFEGSKTDQLLSQLQFEGGFNGGGLEYLMNSDFNGNATCCFKAKAHYQVARFFNMSLPENQNRTDEWKTTRGCMSKTVCDLATKGGIMNTCNGNLCLCNTDSCNYGNRRKILTILTVITPIILLLLSA